MNQLAALIHRGLLSYCWGPLVTSLAGIAIISPHVVQSEYNDNLGNYSTAIKVLACVVPLLAAAVA